MKVRLCVTLRALALLRCEPRSTNSELPSAGSCPWGPLCLTHPMLGGGGGGPVLVRALHAAPAPQSQHPKPSTLTTPRLQGAECSKSPPGQKVNPGQSSLGWLHCPPGLNSPFVRGAEGGPRCAAGWAILPQPLIRGEGGCVFYRGIIGVLGTLRACPCGELFHPSRRFCGPGQALSLCYQQVSIGAAAGVLLGRMKGQGKSALCLCMPVG